MKIKKFSRAIVAIAMMLLCNICIFSYDCEIDGNYYTVHYNSFEEPHFRAVVTYKDDNYNSYAGDVIIPEKIGFNGREYIVYKIGEKAFKNSSRLTSIKIPNSITSINFKAFYGCTSLTSIEIPNSLKSIDGYAFSGCTKLEKVYISDLISYCSIDFGFEANPLCFASKLYLNGDLIENLIIPDGVTEIKSNQFYGLSHITTVKIPQSITYINSSAFEGCNKLSEIIWNANSYNPTNQSNGPFYKIRGCITSFTLGENVELIPDDFFLGMTNLKKFNWNVNNTPDFDFSDVVSPIAENITTFTFGKEVESLPKMDLRNMTKLQHIIWNSIDCWSSNRPLFNEENIISFEFGKDVEYIPNGLCRDLKKISEITIPNSVTDIGREAFCGCTSLSSVNIPYGITEIKSETFYECSSLITIEIPNSVEKINSGAFENCISLKEVSIGNSVANIYSNAFTNCTAITKVESNAKTPPEMENSIFDGSVYRNAILYVPKWSKERYQNTSFWDRFYNIVEIEDDNGENPTEILVEGISLNKSTLFALSGEEHQLIAKITPSNATNKTVEWTSSNEEVATVSSDGLVKVLKKGVATITATTTDGTNLSASCEVTCLSGVDEIGTGGYYVTTEVNNIKICNAESGAIVRVYSADGKQIASAVVTDLTTILPVSDKGIYIVIVDGQAVKVIVK